MWQPPNDHRMANGFGPLSQNSVSHSTAPTNFHHHGSMDQPVQNGPITTLNPGMAQTFAATQIGPKAPNVLSQSFPPARPQMVVAQPTVSNVISSGFSSHAGGITNGVHNSVAQMQYPPLSQQPLPMSPPDAPFNAFERPAAPQAFAPPNIGLSRSANFQTTSAPIANNSGNLGQLQRPFVPHPSLHVNEPRSMMQSPMSQETASTSYVTSAASFPQSSTGTFGSRPGFEQGRYPAPSTSAAHTNGWPPRTPMAPTQPPHPPHPRGIQPTFAAPGALPPLPMSGMGSSEASAMNFVLNENRPVNLLQERNILPPCSVVTPKPEVPPIYAHKEANCSPDVFRCTLNAIPRTPDLLKKCKLPLGLLLHPFKDLKHLSVLQASVIVRCKVCRTYINPFVQFPDARRWRCNLCDRVNDLPEEFHFDPVTKTYGEPQRRPEIKNATVEFIAPQEYMPVRKNADNENELRPPQPSAYLYVFDVSSPAIESGYLGVFCRKLAESLDQVPGDSRALIGFIAVDHCVHYFQFSRDGKCPRQLIVSDLDEVFLPHNDNLMANIEDHRSEIKEFLITLPDLFQRTAESRCALGAGLKCAYELINATGGRVSVFLASLPNEGPGKLEPREDPNLRASKDVRHLNPANDHYKLLALECNGQQVALDLFLVSSQYADLATVACMSKFCGGSVMYYPGLHTLKNPLEVIRFEEDLERYLTRKIGFEAVLRIRCTRGLSLHTFHGNAFVRSFDLLALPNINPDAAFGIQVQMDEALPADASTACFQAALLYTSSKGERRIRVHTLCVPLTNALADVHAKADAQAVVALLARMAVDRAVSGSMADAREALVNACVDSFAAYASTLTSGQRVGALVAPPSLRLLPLYILGLLKHPAFTFGTSIRLDQRVFAMSEFKTAPLFYLMLQVYPGLYPLHVVDEQTPEPPLLQLSFEKIDRHGVYLLDLGRYLYLYVGQAISDRLCASLFNVQSFAHVSEDVLELPVMDTPQNELVRKFIDSLRERRPFSAPLITIKDGSPTATLFTMRLVDDRTESTFSYIEFLQHVHREVNNIVK